ncbi:MAG: DUF411 domain-containing protein [Rhodospirillaceae bacterium]|nr:DUF411 domain-containing protein [Rhodospirillaceae bacterium]
MRLVATFTLIASLFAATAIIGAAPADADEPVLTGTLYKDPACGCCAEYGAYLRENGFELEIVNTEDMASIKHAHGVPADLEGCHSLTIGDYIVEGHVPVAVILRLLTEQPDIAGISLPGMPMGSPGMSGDKEAPFEIYAIGDNGEDPAVYAVE